ncbi:MAG: hypothetical protein M0P16_13375 [Syntrophales bacterium]|nr:hypothetical protein [Syntrophales bacterium]MCK9390050.1 hypothetical protein [Syntrophales bacterium]
MTQLHPLEKIRTAMDQILQYDKSLFIEKLRLGDMPSDTSRCDLEQIFGLTAYIREMPIDGLVENDRASLDESLEQINALFREIHDYDAVATVDVERKIRGKIRERADHLYDITLPWRGLINFLYEST